MRVKHLVIAATAFSVLAISSTTAVAESQDKNQPEKPNILVIWGDDIGWQNVSAYGMGTMGYTTPNIDSIGMEGIRFTDHYAQA
ncbi:sulfatase-like hydrolase/transferase [Marinobacter sp. 1Y8]